MPGTYAISLELLATPYTVQPADIFEEDLDKYNQRTTYFAWAKGNNTRTQHNDYRAGPIRIDWMNLAPRTPATSKKESSRDSTRSSSKGPINASFQPSTSNPVETKLSFGTAHLSEGVVRLFRDILPEGEASHNVPQHDGTMLAVLAVPSHMTPADFLTFVTPGDEGVSHIRLLRDVCENRSLVLLKFRSRDLAEEFAQSFNGRPFDPNEPSAEVCHVVRVSSVSVDVVDQATSDLLQMPAKDSPHAYELPTCPVCLERMDSAITGLVTVPCSHTFHCVCLSKWGDSRCPVCRYSQSLLTSHPQNEHHPPFSPPTPTSSTCSSCSSSTNLWICLLCGNVGCGRYGRAHAHSHYKSTNHLYALELETQRVWDYAGDGYVHRLIQNRTDGKLVELPSAAAMTPRLANYTVGRSDNARPNRSAPLAPTPSSGPQTKTTHPSSPSHHISDGQGEGGSGSAPRSKPDDNSGPGPADALAAEKVEAIGIEYSYLLTSQLDSQRAFFETQIASLESSLLEARAQTERLEDRLSEKAGVENEAKRASVKAEKAVENVKRLEKELAEERTVSRGLMTNMELLKSRAEEAEKERGEMAERLKDMEEQLRDVMFFLEARDKIADSVTTAEDGGSASAPILSEAVGGTVSLPPPPPTTNGTSGGGKKKQKKRKA